MNLAIHENDTADELDIEGYSDIFQFSIHWQYYSRWLIHRLFHFQACPSWNNWDINWNRKNLKIAYFSFCSIFYIFFLKKVPGDQIFYLILPPMTNLSTVSFSDMAKFKQLSNKLKLINLKNANFSFNSIFIFIFRASCRWTNFSVLGQYNRPWLIHGLCHFQVWPSSNNWVIN